MQRNDKLVRKSIPLRFTVHVTWLLDCMSLRTLNLRPWAIRASPLHFPRSPNSQNGFRRSTSTPSTASPSKPSRGIRVTTVFGALLVFGIGSTAYGLYVHLSFVLPSLLSCPVNMEVSRVFAILTPWLFARKIRFLQHTHSLAFRGQERFACGAESPQSR